MTQGKDEAMNNVDMRSTAETSEEERNDDEEGPERMFDREVEELAR